MTTITAPKNAEDQLVPLTVSLDALPGAGD